ncbi:MAG: major facilitator transporter [Nocardia sp.]|uniref:MFS transporter n=1 Tax=Nocardia sp. TaxID=1821 RepID=UPI00262966D0|nr:MFS transporter [Nocardia sp.]MCU1640745.1 major facilitator transporter [Nocardia sp.]
MTEPALGESSIQETPAPADHPMKMLWASIVGYAVDGFDMLLLSVALVSITASLKLTTGQAGSLASYTLFGAVVGGILFGMLSDRIGRVRVLTWTILLFAVFTGLCALAQDYTQMVILRFLAGVGLGGEFGIGMTLAAETWPAAKRARATSYVALGWQFGVLLASLSGLWLLPHLGWRGLFALGVLPAVIAYLFRRKIGEPAMFTAATHKSVPISELWRDRATVKISLGLIVLTSVQNFGYFGLMTWLPSYLAKHLHYGLTKTATWTSVTVLGMAVGIVVFGWIADRFGRRPALCGFQLGAAISVVAYSQLTSSGALLIGGAIMGFFVNGMLGGYGALLAELFPTEARATAENVLFNIGRGVGGFGPWLIGLLIAHYTFNSTIGFLGCIYLVALVTTVFLIPERRGVALV